MEQFLAEQLQAQKDKRDYALVTIVKTEGITPRNIGSKMLVFSDASTLGSVGGGMVEKNVIADTLQCIKEKANELKEYENFSQDDGSECTGKIQVFIETIMSKPHLVICGAGHVGTAVANIAKSAGYFVTAVDTRKPIAESNIQHVVDEFIHINDYREGIDSLQVSPGAYFLVSSHEHSEDANILAAVLLKEPKYVGMLGSKKKIEYVFEQMREEGFKDEQLNSVNTPIGLDIGGELPEEIAISIVAEMQMVRYDTGGGPLKDK